MVALFHFIPDADDLVGVLSRLTAPLTPGSYLVISHVTDDGTHDMGQLREISSRSGIEGVTRSHEVEALFGEFPAR